MIFKDLPQWRLYIAGEGPDREVLEEQVRSSGIADRVNFLGFVPVPRLLYERSDIFVLADHSDPCSLSIGEARAAGCAIVATSVGGTPEMLEFGRAGRLVSPGNPEQLATELRALMTNPKILAHMRRAARDGSEIFDVQRLVGDYERVYCKARGDNRWDG
jgi:glycosyltransferase involved in cell wall biosynthesis